MRQVAFKKLSLGKRMRRLRESRGDSLRVAAAAMGTSFINLHDMEQDRNTNPKLNTMLAICRRYGMTVQDFLEGIS